MARNYNQVLKELNRQRRHIEKAIADLEAIERERAESDSARKRGGLAQQLLNRRKNGTTGDVIPFVRPGE